MSTSNPPTPLPPGQQSSAQTPQVASQAFPPDDTAAELAALATRLKQADDAYGAADRARRRAFAIAYDSGAMTLKQIGEAVGRKDHAIRSLIDGYSDRAGGRAAAASAALEQLGA